MRFADMDLDTCKQRYDFTPAEMKLVVELVNGRSIKESARKLGITEGTIRNHLKQVFRKTGTHRQGELIALLLGGANDDPA